MKAFMTCAHRGFQPLIDATTSHVGESKRLLLENLERSMGIEPEGAPDAWLEVNPTFARGLFGIVTKILRCLKNYSCAPPAELVGLQKR
jgi:hypothetical protein